MTAPSTRSATMRPNIGTTSRRRASNTMMRNGRSPRTSKRFCATLMAVADRAPILAALHSQIGLTHAVVGEQRLAGAAQRDAAVLQHVGGGRKLERDRDVLLDQETGQAFAVELANGAQHVLHDGGGGPERRLVEHDELGRAHQAAADGEHLLLAAR